MRAGFMNRAQDGFKDQMRIAENFVIGETKNTIAAGGQKASPGFIAGRGGISAVMVAIEFDDEAGGGAEEIGDMRSDGLLAAEPDWQAAIAQQRPEQTLGIGRVGAQGLGESTLEFLAADAGRLSDYRHSTLRAIARTPPRIAPQFDPPSRGG